MSKRWVLLFSGAQGKFLKYRINISIQNTGVLTPLTKFACNSTHLFQRIFSWSKHFCHSFSDMLKSCTIVSFVGAEGSTSFNLTLETNQMYINDACFSLAQEHVYKQRLKESHCCKTFFFKKRDMYCFHGSNQGRLSVVVFCLFVFFFGGCLLIIVFWFGGFGGVVFRFFPLIGFLTDRFLIFFFFFFFTYLVLQTFSAPLFRNPLVSQPQDCWLLLSYHHLRLTLLLLMDVSRKSFSDFI